MALVTGEERIVPDRAAYWVCTVEAMPEGMGADFLAVSGGVWQADEAAAVRAFAEVLALS